MGQSQQNLVILGQSVSKMGNNFNEDASCFKSSPSHEKTWIAVSDGASNAIFAGEWAKTLVNNLSLEWFGLDKDDLTRAIKKLGMAHQTKYEDVKTNLFVKNKFSSVGSQATLLAVQLTPTDSGYTAEAFALGDSCLLKIDMKTFRLVDTFPLKKVEDFSDNPPLVQHRIDDTIPFSKTEWKLENGHILLLATDALAKWLWELCEKKQGEQALRQLLPSLKSSKEFIRFVNKQRKSPNNPLWNDDTTGMVCMSKTTYNSYKTLFEQYVPLEKESNRSRFPVLAIYFFAVLFLVLMGWFGMTNFGLTQKVAETEQELGQYFKNGVLAEDRYGSFWTLWEDWQSYMQKVPEFQALQAIRKSRKQVEDEYQDYRANAPAISIQERLNKLERIGQSLLSLGEKEKKFSQEESGKKFESQMNEYLVSFKRPMDEYFEDLGNLKKEFDIIQNASAHLSAFSQNTYLEVTNYLNSLRACEQAYQAELSSSTFVLKKIKNITDIKRTLEQLMTRKAAIQENKRVLLAEARQIIETEAKKARMLEEEKNKLAAKDQTKSPESQPPEKNATEPETKETVKEPETKEPETKEPAKEDSLSKKSPDKTDNEGSKAKPGKKTPKEKEEMQAKWDEFKKEVAQNAKMKEVREMEYFIQYSLGKAGLKLLPFEMQDDINRIQQFSQKISQKLCPDEATVNELKLYFPELCKKISPILTEARQFKRTKIKKLESLFTIKEQYLEHKKTGIKFIAIPSGTYRLGKEAIKIAGYLIGKYEITEEEWQSVMQDDTDSTHYPKANVTWNQCQSFCKKAEMRLPTGIEWEIAARGGTDGEYLWDEASNKESWEYNDYAWVYNASEKRENRSKVGKKRANQYGLHDVIGNVWEWVSDDKEGKKAIRGGSGFYNFNGKPPDKETYKFTYQEFRDPKEGYESIGFRCALSW